MRSYPEISRISLQAMQKLWHTTSQVFVTYQQQQGTFRAHWACQNSILQRNQGAVTLGVQDRLRLSYGMVNIARGTLVTQRTRWAVAQVKVGSLRPWNPPARAHRSLLLLNREIATPDLRSADRAWGAWCDWALPCNIRRGLQLTYPPGMYSGFIDMGPDKSHQIH